MELSNVLGPNVANAMKLPKLVSCLGRVSDAGFLKLYLN
jgi:hypothetical protein